MAHVNVFVGSETGLLKGVTLANKSWKNLKSLQAPDKQQEITAMCWSSESQTQVCLGLRSQQVQTYDVLHENIVTTYDFNGGSGPLRGLAKNDGKHITCSESGLLSVWDNTKKSFELDAGPDINCMRQNRTNPHMVATGGKENELKLWDLQSSSTTPVFTAKNVRSDWLDLRVPVWVTDIAFRPDTNTIYTCTRHNHVRIYDPRTPQRRPVKEMKYLDHPLLSMSLRPGHSDQVLVGSSQGYLGLLDMRGKGYQVQSYKGFAGGIRCVECHTSADLVASCGLDRFLYIHNITSKELIHKFYLKSRLNSLLFASVDPYAKPVSKTSDVSVKSSLKDAAAADAGDSRDSGDEMWEAMEVVKAKSQQDKAVKKKRKRKKEKRYDNADSDDEIITQAGKRSKENKKNSKKKKKSQV